VSDEASEFICPTCDAVMLVAASDSEQVVDCPACHQQVTIPAAAPTNPPANDNELDHLRIMQRSTLRRALYRSRSHAVIAAVVCLVAGVQLAISTINAIRTRSLVWATAYVVLMITSAIGATFFYRRAIALHREATQSAQRQEATPTIADFTPFSGGDAGRIREDQL
jgi:hypothetical protein